MQKVLIGKFVVSKESMSKFLEAARRPNIAVAQAQADLHSARVI